MQTVRVGDDAPRDNFPQSPVDVWIVIFQPGISILRTVNNMKTENDYQKDHWNCLVMQKIAGSGIQGVNQGARFPSARPYYGQ